MTSRVLLGNEAIARGLVEGGCQVMASYPGTPASEILPGVLKFREEEGLDVYVEWSINEKVAFEIALAASYAGKRAAVAMKQVGLNVASDPLMSSIYTGVKGGFVIISADDPGPYSSQTEQDSRFWGLLAKVPVLDPSSPQEAKEMAKYAFELSERFEIPVLLRPTLRICHARQTIKFDPPRREDRTAAFEKNPHRWAATPRYRYTLHRDLSRKLAAIKKEYETSRFNFSILAGAPLRPSSKPFPLGIIAGGIVYGTLRDLLEDMGIDAEIPVLRIGTPCPFPEEVVRPFVSFCHHILVLEEPDAVLELQLREREKVRGRLDGTVPKEGELTPEVVERILKQVGRELGIISEAEGESLGVEAEIPLRRPTLCSGCPHRAAFYAIRRAFPQAIFPSDIGCYTLGLNLGAVDIILDMGAAINIASGLYQAYRQDGQRVPIVATIGDSTFFHAGIPALVNAVHNRARFVLVILDNSTTAMTGMQPTPASNQAVDRGQAEAVSIEDLVRGCGIEYLRIIDPYDIPEMISVVREAQRHTEEERGGVAVIISRHPCIQLIREMPVEKRVKVVIQPPPSSIEKEILKPLYQDRTPPCNEACPAGTDVEAFLSFLAQGNLEEAVQEILKRHPFPSVCGRVCFHPCEEACNRGQWDQPVAIAALERAIGDEGGRIALEKKRRGNGIQVAVVGGGPAGLTCAYNLALLGYKVHVFEAQPEVGGMLRYGIPPYRLPKDVLRREIDRIKSLGVMISTGVRVGMNISLEELKRNFKAVFLATGAHKRKKLRIPGEDLEGVYQGLDILQAINMGKEIEIKGRIGVIGGGNTAIDVARCLLRMGCSTTIFYRRTEEEMPAYHQEVQEALAEGVKIEYLVSPVRILEEGGRIRAVELVKMRRADMGDDGRREVSPIDGSQFTMELEGVVVAIGEEPDLSFLNCELDELKKGIFIGGDLLPQPRTVAHALGSGRRGALAIHKYLQGDVDMPSTQKIRVLQKVSIEDIDLSWFPQQNRPSLPRISKKRAARGFVEVQRGISLMQAQKEAAERCFHCGSCTKCDYCLISCPEEAIVRGEEGYRIDLDKCTLCRLCAEVCPRGAISMPMVEGCVGCGYCLKLFECPSLIMSDTKAEVDESTCIQCGLCVYVCPQGAIKENKS